MTEPTQAQTPAPALNPLQAWTDFNLRMLDWMVSSGQQAGEQADRLARGGGAAQLQTAGWVWMAQAWRQWFELLGAFNPAADAHLQTPPDNPASPSSRRASARGKSS